MASNVTNYSPLQFTMLRVARLITRIWSPRRIDISTYQISNENRDRLFGLSDLDISINPAIIRYIEVRYFIMIYMELYDTISGTNDDDITFLVFKINRLAVPTSR